MTALKIETPRVFQPMLRRSRYKAAYGGRGSGKSHFYAELLIERALIERVFAVCVRETQRSLGESVKRLLETKIETLGLGKYFRVMDNKIETPHGGQIIFQGMQNHTADSIKSLEGYDIAWVEEAQALSQRSLDLLRPTIRKNDSEIWFSWNPEFEDDPVDALFRGDQPPKDSIVISVNWRDNPWLPDILLDEMEMDKKRDREKYLHVWEGDYNKRSDAQVFSNWRVEEFDSPDGTHFRFGADWGYAEDPTVLVRCFMSGRALYIDYDVSMVNCEIDQTPDLFDSIPESRKFWITADGSRPETISYMRRNGFSKIRPAVKGKGSVEDGIEWLKSFDLIVHPRCETVIYELEHYRWKVDPQTDEVLPILEDKHNHAIDALRYACEGARRFSQNTNKSEKKPTGKPGGWMGG